MPKKEGGGGWIEEKVERRKNEGVKRFDWREEEEGRMVGMMKEDDQ